MLVEARVDIEAPAAVVWAVVTDIEHAAEHVSAIDKVEILERPARGLVGLKWRETRTVFGKTATEVMWVTDAVEDASYRVRAESHGFVYESEIVVAGQGSRTTLTMRHDSTPQSALARVLSLPMGLLFKGAMKKAFLKDLVDIKAVAERRAGDGPA